VCSPNPRPFRPLDPEADVHAPANEPALLLIELGLIVVGLATLGRLAHRFGFSTIPLYLVAGLAFGTGGLAPVESSHEFVRVGGEIGVLLLLFMLGLETPADSLASRMRSTWPAGLADLLLNFIPGFAAALVMGWSVPTAALLGGVTWVSSSGVAAKILSESGRLKAPETPVVLAILVMEDLAMAVFLPLASWSMSGGVAGGGLLGVVGTLVAVALALFLAFRSRGLAARLMSHRSDEVVMFTALGLMLLVAGLAQRFHVSAAVGAFVLGLSLSGPMARRAEGLLGPLRDLFAAMFFVFFGLQIDPSTLQPVLLPAAALCAVTTLTKLGTGWLGARAAGLDRAAGRRAGAALVARGEFSIALAGLGLASGARPELGTLAAAYVLLTAIVGPLLARRA
jgi:CPA2 family monovalent cation:H+ antiporter-2